jgi:uncharacterized membrane protein HdeD (DUF308 family)
MLDLRTPTGWFFSILGVILLGLGVFAPGHASLTTLNVNLYSGLPILTFGCVMLFLSRSRS